MTVAKIKVEGLSRTVRQLKTLGVEIAAEVKVLNRASAEIVAKDTSSRAPKRSGKLGRSVRAGATANTGTVRVGSSLVPYAGPIIFGWGRRGIARNPFPFESLEANEPGIVEMYDAGVRQLVERTVHGVGGE